MTDARRMVDDRSLGLILLAVDQADYAMRKAQAKRTALRTAKEHALIVRAGDRLAAIRARRGDTGVRHILALAGVGPMAARRVERGAAIASPRTAAMLLRAIAEDRSQLPLLISDQRSLDL